MGQSEKWLTVDSQLVGLAVCHAMRNLLRGESDEVDLECQGQWMRIICDPRTARLVLIPLDNQEGEDT